MSDVRDSARALLVQFDPPEEKTDLELLLAKAVELLCRPKFAECESGAAIVGLCLKWAKKGGTVRFVKYGYFIMYYSAA
jgi:hypothetical protein